MSKNDIETRKSLITPHIEISDEFNSGIYAYVNVDTFYSVSGMVLRKEPGGKSFYRVHGVVDDFYPKGGRIGHGVNIGSDPLSRTLMGYIMKDDMKDELPKVYKYLESMKSRD